MVLKCKLHTISLHCSLFQHKLTNCSISSPESQITSRSIMDIQCKVCEVPSGILIYKMQDKTHYHLKESRENVRGEKGANINYQETLTLRQTMGTAIIYICTNSLARTVTWCEQFHSPGKWPWSLLIKIWIQSSVFQCVCWSKWADGNNIVRIVTGLRQGREISLYYKAHRPMLGPSLTAIQWTPQCT